ncbi:MAG: ABC transporter permease [Ferruginibacter sp.]|nr:ABC transporter permease [Ferruginibacter sp.]
MISKLIASVKKEALLLLRDRVGLSILFIMPMVLIFVMTLIQDAAFKTINEKGIPIVFVNNDNDSLGNQIANGLMHNDLCSYNDSINGKLATAELAQKAVADGKFLVGVVIPKGATEAIRKSVTNLVNQTLDNSNLKASTNIAISDSVEITILIDPVAKKSFINSVTSNLHEFISEIKTKIMFQTFSEQIADVIPDKKNAPKSAYSQTQIIKYKEVYASKNEDKIIPNAVQHNVPAWAIFAMFFIAIPLSGSIMKEKNEGSVFRLHTMPSSYLLLVNGKIIVYVLVCMLQFLLMLTVGLYFLPMLGLPKLVLGNSYFAIFLLTMATAFAATGYGVMVGTLASTEHQAAIMGSLSILLLSALGGVWVPSYVMPEVMRNISAFSPLNWALSGFYKLFLRGGNVSHIIYDVLKLMFFFFVTMIIAHFAHTKKRTV